MSEGALIESEEFYGEIFSDLEIEEKVSVEVISSGNLEIDRKLEGGIPVGSLGLLEGGNDSGKSIFLQQIMYGALERDKKVFTFTTEKSAKDLLKGMEELSFNISDYFIIGRSRIFEINANYIEENPRLSENLLQVLLECIKKSEEELILIDSLTVFVVNSSENAVLNFFTECIKLCDGGKTILISVHGYAFSQALLHRIRSICDTYLELRIEYVGDKWIKTMEIQKLRGAKKITGNVLSFDVDNEVGLKIIPVSNVKA
ncbi:flagellar accessory protein FlaH [Methanosarcina sp. KYL-1]|uniref:PRK06067 family protein n=1 Tax=Methanosarcina sp. KYL-1 TaxID=2602068 RepID=UPI00210166FE|nr:ATPase domain-containing protein [Methanosarcina sp. KYL-1]MCQ1536958.1 flagellar accessory protein FlaH [Methanosarcina sp. KYL-1]